MAEGSPLDVIIITKDGIWESTCSTQDELLECFSERATTYL